MSSNIKNTKPLSGKTSQAVGRRPTWRVAALVLGGLIVACLVGLWWRYHGAGVSDQKATYEVLQGRWQRQEGGYIVEVKRADATGLDVAYFNPKSIHVSKAKAWQTNGVIRFFIELRDVNYPGSTYQLTYDPKTDQLDGSYFQAAIKQSFDVVFKREQQ